MCFQSHNIETSHLDCGVLDGENTIIIVLDCIIYITLKYQCITRITIIKCFTPYQIINWYPPPNFLLKLSKIVMLHSVNPSVRIWSDRSTGSSRWILSVAIDLWQYLYFDGFDKIRCVIGPTNITLVGCSSMLSLALALDTHLYP